MSHDPARSTCRAIGLSVLGKLTSSQQVIEIPVANGQKLPLFEIARVLVRLDHVARVIVNANHSIMRAAVKLCVADCITDCVRQGLRLDKRNEIKAGQCSEEFAGRSSKSRPVVHIHSARIVSSRMDERFSSNSMNVKIAGWRIV